MSYFGIGLAGKSLDAFQEAINVTSDNIANISTTGASRQQANLTQVDPITGSPFYSTHSMPGTFGDGVVVSSISRVHDDSYDTLFRGATSSQSFYTTQSQQLQATQSALGEPSNGINSAYTAFQTSIQTLANNPQGTPERTNVINAAQTLVSSLNNAGANIAAQEQNVITQAGTYVITINNTLDQIAALNAQIRASTAVGDNPNTYKDQRDTAIDKLSGLLPTQTSIQANGSTLVTVGGIALVNDTIAYHIAPPVVGTNPDGTPALKVGLTSDPNPTDPVPLPVTSGTLGGLLDLYNNKLLVYGRKLDSFASGLARETARLTNAAYDPQGVQGAALFQPRVTQLPISAGNIQVGITDPAAIPAANVTTLAGTLVQPANSANNTIDTTTSVANNTTLANPSNAAGFTGSLNIAIDNIAGGVTINYQVGGVVPAGTIDATTIDSFINGFNGQHVGITASFDATSQRIVFARDPTNVDLTHRAAQGNALSTAAFTITDSNVAGVGPPQPALGTVITGPGSGGILTILGANQISGVQQDSTNAYGATSAGGANALLSLFSASLGAPGIQTTTNGPAFAAGQTTLTSPLPAPPATTYPYDSINVGDVLTIGTPATGDQENVTVTAVNRATHTITFSAKNAHGANEAITSAQTATLQTYYAGIVSQLGLDGQTATTGASTQTTLSSNIDKARQSVDGINLDEETNNLVKYQSAYSAAARVLSTLDTMLGTALGLIGYTPG